ncbi:MAG: hypothetical protein ACFE0R_05765, partial [Salinarimonas sp.]
MRNDDLIAAPVNPASGAGEEASQPVTQRPIVLAQADLGSPETPPSEGPGETVRLVVVARDGEVVTLPAGTSLDEIEIRDGDIVLVQPDGSVIVIENGVEVVPTIVVGDVEIPSETILAALEGVAAAAGAEGGAQQQGGSGGDFNDVGQQDIGDGFGLSDVLGDTEFGDRVGATNETDIDNYAAPSIGEGGFAFAIVAEASLDTTADGFDLAPGGATGRLALSDAGESVQIIGPLVSAGTRPFTIAFADPVGITIIDATGEPVSGLVIEWNLVAGGTRLEGFIRGPGAYATEPGTGSPSIILELTGTAAEAFGSATPVLTVTLVDAFPHTQAGLDALAVNGIFIQVDDGFAPSATISAPILLSIGDDVPEIGSPAPAAIDDDNLANGTSPDVPATTQTGSLAITWGADAHDVADGAAGQDAPGGIGDRSATFAAIAAQPTLPTSGGAALEYVLLENDTIVEVRKIGAAEVVLRVSLSDDGVGSYTVEQLGSLDHEGDTLALSFAFVATDADGDTAQGVFTITVEDDAPVATQVVETGSVSEAALDTSLSQGTGEDGQADGP